MVGMKIMFVFGKNTLNREIIFCCFRELLCRYLALVHCRLMTVVSILSFSFKKKNGATKSTNSPRGETSNHCTAGFGVCSKSWSMLTDMSQNILRIIIFYSGTKGTCLLISIGRSIMRYLIIPMSILIKKKWSTLIQSITNAGMVP